jgi:hypothetical protein
VHIHSENEKIRFLMYIFDISVVLTSGAQAVWSY